MTAKEIVSLLKIEEKCALLSGKNEWMSRDIPRLDLQSIVFSDGPHGLRRQGDTGDHLGLGGIPSRNLLPYCGNRSFLLG